MSSAVRVFRLENTHTRGTEGGTQTKLGKPKQFFYLSFLSAVAGSLLVEGELPLYKEEDEGQAKRKTDKENSIKEIGLPSGILVLG